jgi:hypothetical protein
MTNRHPTSFYSYNEDPHLAIGHEFVYPSPKGSELIVSASVNQWVGKQGINLQISNRSACSYKSVVSSEKPV